MKKYIIIQALAIPLLIASCSKEGAAPEEKGVPIGIDYGSRADGHSGATKTGRTFTVVSYPELTNEPVSTDSQRPTGFYVYDEAAVGGIFIPADVTPTVPHSYVQRNPAKGQALLAGNYRTALVSPAYPMTASTQLGSQRIVFQRTEEIFSCPWFPMTVTGYEVFALPDDLEMRDLRASVLLEIWQGGTSGYVVQNGSAVAEKGNLLNAGTYGWFHPLHRQTTLSYGTLASPSFDGGGTEEIDIPATGNTGTGIMTHATDEIYVFSAEYSSEYVLPMAFAFDLLMDGQTDPFRLNIPLSIDMAMGKRYKFKLTVKSRGVILSYTVKDWNTGYDDTGEEIGGDGDIEIPYGQWTAEGGWKPGGDNSDTIGETTP